MAYHERELTVSEPDEPNVMAVYIIIVLSLLGLAVTMYGLAEYKGHLDSKRKARIESLAFEAAQEKKNAAGMKVIDQIINAKPTAEK